MPNQILDTKKSEIEDPCPDCGSPILPVRDPVDENLIKWACLQGHLIKLDTTKINDQ